MGHESPTSHTLVKIQDVLDSKQSQRDKVEAIRDALRGATSTSARYGGTSEDSRVENKSDKTGQGYGESSVNKSDKSGQGYDESSAKKSGGSKVGDHHLSGKEHDEIRDAMEEAARKSVQKAADHTTQVAKQAGIDHQDAESLAHNAVQQAADDH